MEHNQLAAFADEMIKIALNKKERREQLLKYTAVGAAMTPIVLGAGNLIMGGKKGFIKNLTQGERLSRWLPAKMVAGAIGGSVAPIIRRSVDKGVERKARKRLSHYEQLRRRRERYRLNHPRFGK